MDGVGHEAEDGYLEPVVFRCAQELLEGERDCASVGEVLTTVIRRESKEISQLSEVVEVAQMFGVPGEHAD